MAERGLEEKRMFGTRAFLLDGRILVGARKEGVLLVRVTEEKGATLLTEPGVSVAVMGAKSMGPSWLDVAATAIESDDASKKAIVEQTVRAIYAPVIDVHWVTIKQLAQLEPTLVETVACMIGALLNEALDETVKTMGVPEAAARSILYGHTQVALANGLRGDNPFSDACLIAMDYGRESIIKDDWKKIFRDDELDKNLARMLHLDRIER